MKKIYLIFLILNALLFPLRLSFAEDLYTKEYIQKLRKSVSSTRKKLTKLEEIKVGDHYGGGVVYYIDEKHRQGIIAADHDCDLKFSNGIKGYYPWGNPRELGINVQGAALFSGELNTDNIFNNIYMSDYKAAIAAFFYGVFNPSECSTDTVTCSLYWSLPSVYELSMMYIFGAPNLPNPNQPNLESNILIPNFIPTKYWSSTEYEPSPDCAWVVNFNNGSLSAEPKDSVFTNYRVRAVRYFTY